MATISKMQTGTCSISIQSDYCVRFDFLNERSIATFLSSALSGGFMNDSTDISTILNTICPFVGDDRAEKIPHALYIASMRERDSAMAEKVECFVRGNAYDIRDAGKWGYESPGLVTLSDLDDFVKRERRNELLWKCAGITVPALMLYYLATHIAHR